MELIERLEYLSKLKFTDEEKKQFESEFQNIVKMVDEIKQLDIEIDADSDRIISLNDLREDTIKESLDQNQVLKNAPKQKDGCYVTPLVVE